MNKVGLYEWYDGGKNERAVMGQSEYWEEQQL